MDATGKDRLYLLGTGTPTPTKLRFGTAYVLQIGRDFLLFDCGPATTFKLVRADLWPTWIDYLFLTHHHFDHNADLPCFLLCRWDQSTGRENPLQIFGPPPTREIVRKLVGPDGAFADDWKARVGAPVSQHVHKNRGGSLPRPLPAFTAADVGPGEVFRHGEWRVTAAPAHHVEPWLQSLAYRVDTKRGSIVFAGDTGPCAQINDFAKGADVFVANCWNHQKTMDEDGEAPGQTGTLDAARFARDSGAGMLVLTHTGPSLCERRSREKAISDIASIYKGKIVFGEEGMVLNLWG
ncbi:MAG: MBL fold metallo-hydrolase [Lentisphaerae bacterium]|nr:MBL fold metallo-hydrolase [Lentisphaerota bacterium]